MEIDLTVLLISNNDAIANENTNKLDQSIKNDVISYMTIDDKYILGNEKASAIDKTEN